MFTGNRVSTNGVVANRWVLAIGLAIASMAVAAGCVADDDHGSSDPRAASTGVTEQEGRIESCESDYFDSAGGQIGWCVLPCNGPKQCGGITSGWQVASIEASCERCW